MHELSKITYDQQRQLHEWLKALVPQEHFADLEKTLVDIVKEHCASHKGSTIFFNESFRKEILQELQFAINNYLEKNALQKIIAASLLPLQPLQLDKLTTTTLFYQAINNYEYETIKIPKLANLPETVQVRKSLTHERQIRIDLIKRIVSLWRATEIALGSFLNDKMKKHFLDHIMAIQNLPEAKLTSFRTLQKITSKYLPSLSWTIAEVISRKLRIQPIEAQKLLSKMEGLANWERQRVCTISVTPMKVDKKHHLQIDAPLKMQLTPDQQQEYARITEENVSKQPSWFRSLHPLEKRWLVRNKQKIINGELYCPSSLTRHLPGVTNFSEFTNIIADKNYEPVSLHTSIRRHTLSVTVKDAEENQRLTRQNGEQLFVCAKPKERFSTFWNGVLNSKPKVLFLDLGALTPLNSGAASIVDLVPYQENNTYMQNANEAAIDHLASKASNDVIVLGVNIAVNTEREYSENFIEYSFRQVSAKLNTYISQFCYDLSLQKSIPAILRVDLKRLHRLLVDPKPDLHALNTIINSFKNEMQQAEIANTFFAGDRRKAHRFILAFEALHDYLFITINHARIDDAHNKALFAAALLQITVSHLGGTVTGGCKSAKDRWGTVLMQTSAMLAYYNKYGELPKVTDQGATRTQFVNEFTTVYLSGHQQHMANVNVYGANGTLDGTNPPTRVLQKMGMEFIPMVPHDIQKAIGKERIETHQMFAKSSKWKFRDPHSYWKLFLYDLSNIFHTLTCGIFRKRRPHANDSKPKDGITDRGSLAKLANLCKPHDTSLSPPEVIVAPVPHADMHVQSAPVLPKAELTASTSPDTEQDRHLRARPLLLS